MGVEKAVVQLLDENDCVTGWALNVVDVTAPALRDLPGRITALSGRVDGLEGRLSSIEDKLDGIVDVLVDVGATLRALRDALGGG